MLLSNGSTVKLPGVYRRIKENMDIFIEIMTKENSNVFSESSTIDKCQLDDKLIRWAEKVSEVSKVDYDISMDYYERFSELMDRIDDPFLLETLLQQIPLFANYVGSVINYLFGSEIGGKIHSGQEKLDYLHSLDVKRHNDHEAVIAASKLIDRIASSYGFRVFDGVNLDNRHEVAIAVGNFVNCMYRTEISRS